MLLGKSYATKTSLRTHWIWTALGVTMGGLCSGGTVKQNPKVTGDYTNTNKIKTTKQEGTDWSSNPYANSITKTTKPKSPLPEPKPGRPKPFPSDSKPPTPSSIKPSPTRSTPSTPTRPWVCAFMTINLVMNYELWLLLLLFFCFVFFIYELWWLT